MQYQIIDNNSFTTETDLLILGIYQDHSFTKSGESANKLSQNKLHDVITQQQFNAKIGKHTLLNHIEGINSRHILLIGLGKKELNVTSLRKLINSAYHTANQLSVATLHSTLHEIAINHQSEQQLLGLSVIEWEKSSYQFTEFKTSGEKNSLKTIYFGSDNNHEEANKQLKQYECIAHGMTFTRNLGNTPPNICTPNYLLEQAKQLAEKHDTLSVSNIDEQHAKKLGMGAFCSVSQGSAETGQMIFIHYKNAGEQAPIALIGKGICFDTGGNDLKSREVMKWMKFDMCGAASVLGTLQACAEMNLPINIIGVMVCAENMIGRDATRPGDIIKTLAGYTVEIENTDAEGRLVLCDALTHTQREYQPSHIVDVATLTGAVIAAFASNHTAVMTNNDAFSGDIINAGKQIHDQCWPMPVGGDYSTILDSTIADMVNGRLTGEASSVVAATYLSRFIENNTPWAHLDIAGTSIIPGKSTSASGRPVPLLCQLLMNMSKNHAAD